MAANILMGIALRPVALGDVDEGTPRRPVQCQDEAQRERIQGVNHGDVDLHGDLITDVIDMHPFISTLVTSNSRYNVASTQGPVIPLKTQIPPSALLTNVTRYEDQVALPGPQNGPTRTPIVPTSRASVRDSVTVYYVTSEQAMAEGAQFRSQLTAGKSNSNSSHQSSHSRDRL